MEKTQRIPQSRMIAIAGLVLVVGLIILAAYLHFAKGFVWAAGTGLDQKTFWDWLELLIVPAMLALGVFLLNSVQQGRDQKRAETDSAIAEDRQRETALQNYLDKMTDLLLEHNLVTVGPEAEVKNVARSRTLTTLRTLDPTRKGLLVSFLYESGLIKLEVPIVSLKKADLSGAALTYADLSGADLTNANLRGANLKGADLRGTYLMGADLMDANLKGADLTEANLTMANLSGANLTYADLIGAYLTRSHLTGTNLSGANLTYADLIGALYNNQTQWPEVLDPRAAGAVLVP
jgi:uncharacterized protein YjbI with pentapeptide repeats